MPRKVLISFLGKNAYFPSKYYYKTDKSDISEEINYVQEFIIKKFCFNWTKEDKLFFVTTKETIDNNWLNKVVGFDQEKRKPILEQGKGLKYVLENLDLSCNFSNIEIEDGDNEKEIWSIFQTIEKIMLDIEEEEIELCLDITYSFRYLPMLGLVLVDYLRNFKNITITNILYGNYEKGKLDNNESPIIDLTSFAELQSWSSVSNEFVNLGESKNFEKVSKHRELSIQLDDLIKSIRTSRGAKIIYDYDFIHLREKIEEVKQTEAPNQKQIKRVLEKIEEKINAFDNEEIQNGFIAVEWCITYNLVPQGYTLLQESLITWLLSNFLDEKDKILDYKTRLQTRFALQGIERYEKDEEGNDKLNQEGNKIDNWRTKILLTQNMYNYIQNNYKNIIPLYNKLVGNSGLRNDINHAGFKQNYANPVQLTKELENLYKQIKQIIYP